MRIFGLDQRRSFTFMIVSGVFVLGFGLLWFQYPSPITRVLFQATFVVWLGSVVLEGVIEYLKRGDEEESNGGDETQLELLTPLATRLRQNVESEAEEDTGEFFRRPPAWVDFEEEYIVDHPILDTTFTDITSRDEGLFVIEGKPACGKSFLLYSIGKKLLTEEGLSGPEACILPLKDIDRSRLDMLTNEINSLPEGAYVLVDDIHLEPVKLIEIAERFSTHPVTLVFATRPVENYPRNQDKRLESFTTEHYQLVAETVADPIVDRFLEKEGLAGERFRNVKNECMKYQHDLYVLSTALLTYSDIGKVTEDAIYEWIANNVLDTDEHEEINPAPFLIAIACLYRFEVSVARPFLTSYLNLPESDLMFLVREGEILKPSGNTFALHHSSIAQLIIDTAHRKARHSIPSKLREVGRSHPLEWHEAAVQSYIEHEPQLAVEILAGITKTEMEGRVLAHTLLNQIDPKIVATGIDSSYTSVENLGSFFALYLGQEEPIDDALVDELEQFAQVCEDDNASAWAWTTEILARLNIDAAWSFGDRLAPLFSTVEPQMVADILTTISYGKIDSLAESIAEDVDSERIENQLKSTDLPPEELAKVIAKLVWVSPRQFTQLAIDFNTLLLDVEPQDFPVVLCRVAWGNEESAREMLNSLSIGEITTYLDTINDDRYYYRALAAIYLVNPSIIQALKTELSQPDPEKLESSIYRRAAWTLVSEAIDVPVDGLQVGVEGPAHSHFDEQELAAYRQLKACATADDADARECLTGITDSYGPLACLRAVILIPPETMDSLGREQVRSWLTEELAAELPSHIVEVTSATLESPRNGQS